MKNLAASLSMNYKTQKQSEDKPLTLAGLFQKAREKSEGSLKAATVANRNAWNELIKNRFDMFKTFIKKASFIKQGNDALLYRVDRFITTF